MMAFTALESGKVPIGGSTGALVKRSLLALSGLLESSLDDVRAKAGASGHAQAFSLAAFIADAKSIASLDATARGCALTVPEVDRTIGIAGNRDHLLAALNNRKRPGKASCADAFGSAGDCRLPGMRQQFADAAGGLRRQPLEHIFEVSVGVVAVKSSRLDETHHRRGTLSRA